MIGSGPTPDDILDQLLVLRSQDGNSEALRELIGRWQPRLGRLARRLTGDHEAARDVTQESWLAIVKGLGRLRDPARFRSWAYRIVKHKSADWLRKKHSQRDAMKNMRETANTAGHVVQSARSIGTLDEEKSRLKTCMAALPPDHRAVLSLFYVEEMSIAEIALIMDIAPGTVKSRLFYARNKLKDQVERNRK